MRNNEKNVVGKNYFRRIKIKWYDLVHKDTLSLKTIYNVKVCVQIAAKVKYDSR